MTQANYGPPPDEVGRLSFVEATTVKMRSAAAEAIGTHPELRSILIVFDWNGPFNDANIAKGLFVSDNGKLDAMALIGLQRNTLVMLQVLVAKLTSNINEQQRQYELVVKAQLRNMNGNPTGPTGKVGDPG